MTEEAVDARRWLEANGLPTGREEPWRYTPVADLRRRLDDLVATPPIGATAGPTEADLDRLAGRHGAARIVLVDGIHVPSLSTGDLPAGLWFGTSRNLSASVRAHLTTPTAEPPDGFEALNRAESEDVAYLLVVDDADLGEPVHVVHVSSGAVSAHPRLVVDVGVGARVHVIESHVGAGGAGLTNASTTVHLASDATAILHRVQDEAPDAVHVARLEIHQREGSHADVTLLSRGSAIGRTATHIELLEPRSSCRVTGLIAPRPGARHDDVLTVDHAASRCTSELAVRSVVPEGARTSSTGHVIVRPGTVGTSAQQRADALLLHPSAQADSRPWLEIFADDVRANHGSATGRIDEDALFYLRSRGIPRDEARAVLVTAFADAVLAQLPPSLRAHVGGWFGHEGVA